MVQNLSLKKFESKLPCAKVTLGHQQLILQKRILFSFSLFNLYKEI